MELIYNWKLYINGVDIQMELKGVENLEIRRSVYFYYILDDSKLS